MDSLSHLALGAAVGMAVMGRRTALWKAAAWGAVCNTLPDLDVFIDHGDAVANMTLHRGDSHALFWLTLASLPIGAAIARLQGEWPLWRRWWLAAWLALVTHPLLDLMTVYGTQLARPFSDFPFAVGSIFIIDPLFTLPLLIGVGVALATRRATALRWNAAGLVLSAVYLAWGFTAQQHVTTLARQALAQQGHNVQRLLVTPAPFNSVLWRVVAITPQGYLEGFRSLLDGDRPMTFDAFARGESLRGELRDNAPVQDLAAFSQGFYKLSEADGQVLITDLRMGQEPYYTFAFVVAQRHGALSALRPPRSVGTRPRDLQAAFRWLWRRTLGEPVAAPR